MIVKLAIRYFIWSCLGGFALVIFGLFSAPKLDLESSDSQLFWSISIGLAALPALNDIRRCINSPIWNLFVSYKSEDVELVRPVVDALRLAGVRVWFAEYQILLKNYNNFEREIAFGLAHSDGALLFTNDRYIGSKWCRLELEQLLAKCGPKKMIEIRVPPEKLPHQLYSDLEKCYCHDGHDLQGILSCICKATGISEPLPFVRLQELGHQLHEIHCLGEQFTLDIANWEVTTSGQIDESGCIRGLELRFKDTERYMLSVNLYSGLEITPSAQRQGLITDDREFARELRSYASQNWGQRFAVKILGVHTLFHAGYSHLALAYLGMGYWGRKYSIVLPVLPYQQSAEFVFTFGFVGPFPEYLRRTCAMETLVKSLKPIHK
jgi:hypothetical protein